MSERAKEPSPIMLPNMQSVGPLIAAQGRTIWIADAHGYGRRFIVRADEILSAFVELEREVLTVTFYLESIQAADQ
jgi:hypothetical protein